MINGTFFTGDTIKITGEFRNFGEVLVDPTNIQLKVYDESYTIVDTVTLVNRESVGIFTVLYTIPALTTSVMHRPYVFEWYAEIEGNISIYRERINVGFI